MKLFVSLFMKSLKEFSSVLSADWHLDAKHYDISEVFNQWSEIWYACALAFELFLMTYAQFQVKTQVKAMGKRLVCNSV